MPVQQSHNLWWCCPHGALTNSVAACIIHAEAKALLVFFGYAVLGQPLQHMQDEAAAMQCQ
jgi:hypothetical protein